MKFYTQARRDLQSRGELSRRKLIEDLQSENKKSKVLNL